MKRSQDLETILKKMLRARWAWGSFRTDSETNALTEAVSLMHTYKEKAKITDQNIAVLSYLAIHPNALIVADKYTVAAFDAAIRAIALHERSMW